ncbi:hypothetical protein ADK53_28870 [Streptomyces sp. WM6373]|nr:hypothetical protein ADK53_28870 [Streptomyces sp. WM6373]
MTARRLRVLIQGLPPESATMTALRNALPEVELTQQADEGEPEKGRWSQSELLLASAIDALRRVEYVLICANTDSKAKRPSPPEPVRRPGAAPRAQKKELSQAGAETLFKLINGGAA